MQGLSRREWYDCDYHLNLIVLTEYPTTSIRHFISDPTGVAIAAAIPTLVAIALIGIALFFGLKYIQARVRKPLL